ncbi:ATP-binding protein [uncultured Parabacteroides sp.]|uniref:ATP-binding protein n=1 Tax=uncultured Parabacteroides sp. TaxID=512312 RepID=UPI00260BE900|nr:ATP-binding protein [uncultured Parabacteroides sp.]
MVIGNEARLQDITVEDLSRPHPSRLHNKQIADVFYKACFIESWGRGTQRIIDKCVAEGLPASVYEYKMGFLYLIFSNERINELTEMEQKIYDLIRLEPQVRQSDLAVRLNLTEQYVRKIIKRLKDKGLIERLGARKNGYWIVKSGE